MSKKIIAILTIATVLFVCVFASCEKKEEEEGVYTDTKDMLLVTDENGERVLAKDGQLLVYVTDADGEIVTDEAGEKVTQKQQFQPIEEDGVVEDFGFKITLPEGWKTTNKFGEFIRDDEKLACQISIVKYFYDDYYALNLRTYDQLQDAGIDVEWEEDVDLGKDFKKVCRFTMKTDEGLSVLYFFENSGNIYKVLFTGVLTDTVIADTEAFCKAMDFKPFAYYDDVTAVSDKETTAEATTK